MLLGLLKQVPLWAWVMVGLIGFGWGRIVYLQHELHVSQAQVVSIGFQKDSMQAIADSARDITSFLRDSLDLEVENRRFFETRVLQAEQERDDLDIALRRQSVLNGQLRASVDELEGQLEAVTRQEGDDRLASFHKYIEPYTVDMDVRLPPPPNIGTADVSVKVDPIEAGVKVQCGEEDETSGVRPANVLWEGPEWLTIEDLAVSQDREVCNSELLYDIETQESTIQTIWKWTKRVGLVAAGYLAGKGS